MLTFSTHWSIDHLPEKAAQSSLHLKWFFFDPWHWREDRADFNYFWEWLQNTLLFIPFCTQPGNLLSVRLFNFQNTFSKERVIKAVLNQYLLTWKDQICFRILLSFCSITVWKRLYGIFSVVFGRKVLKLVNFTFLLLKKEKKIPSELRFSDQATCVNHYQFIILEGIRFVRIQATQ